MPISICQIKRLTQPHQRDIRILAPFAKHANCVLWRHKTKTPDRMRINPPRDCFASLAMTRLGLRDRNGRHQLVIARSEATKQSRILSSEPGNEK
jgi:hypothetical protein